MSPQPRFDELIHAPYRLRICAMLSAAESIEFATLRDQLDVADSVLSKNLKALADANYIKLIKKSARGRQRTWARLTAAGRTALNGHLAALHEMTAMAIQEPEQTEPEHVS